MRASRLKIHNFRSILDADIELSPYGLLVGPNGAGKSNVLAAVQAFYDAIKFTEGRDFPMMPTSDQESWVEIEFLLTADEAETLKAEYRSPGNTFRVRRYFRTDDASKVGGIYGYEGDKLSDNRFYGAKNVQSAKVGRILYIPAVSKVDDHTKLSGPSSLRELVNFVLKDQLESSPQFGVLSEAFSKFRETLRSGAGAPLVDLEGEITEEIQDWGHSFRLDVRALGADELLKSLVTPKIIDGVLDEELHPSQFGHGFQRHLVFSLMMLAARHAGGTTKKSIKKEFDPDLFWVLYEEPEAFLHPPQAETLNLGLRRFSAAPDHQVTVTTHSPVFASKNLLEVSCLVRLSRERKATVAGQIRSAHVESLFNDNQAVLNALQKAGIRVEADDRIEMEAIKYALWLDPLRACALFAEHVVLVEGPSERALIGYLVDQGRLQLPSGGVAVIDTMGKYNTHRFMNLLTALRVRHSVLFDQDSSKGNNRHRVLNDVIRGSRSPLTVGVDGLDEDLEGFLGLMIPSGTKAHKKPILLMHAVHEGTVPEARLDAFVGRVQTLIAGSGPGRAGTA